jgi:hypothetical protein
MRDRDEIQKAHDTLTAVVLGEVDIGLPDPDALHIVLDVLCWVLCHCDNEAFASNLAALEQTIARAGYVVTEDRRSVDYSDGPRLEER